MKNIFIVLTSITFFLASLTANAVDVTVAPGETRVIDSGFPKVLNKLILGDGAKLVLHNSEIALKLTVQEMTMGKDVIITTQGIDGENATHLTGNESRRSVGIGTGSQGTKGSNGNSGSGGKNITINTGTLSFISFVISTNGGNGGYGGNAKGGGKGTNSDCPAQNGGAGGNGGRGGDGGDGGDAGTALITFNEFHILPDINKQLVNNPYRWVATGGLGGAAGMGGSGGKGGNGSNCGCWSTPLGSGCSHKVSGGNGGNKGSDGNPGRNGSDKDVNTIAWFKYN